MHRPSRLRDRGTRSLDPRGLSLALLLSASTLAPPAPAQVASKKTPADVFVATLVEEHGDALIRYLMRRRVSPHDAEDLFQEVLYGAWIGREQFDPEHGTLRAWLLGIAAHRLAHYREMARRRHKQRRTAKELEAVRSEAPSPEARRLPDRARRPSAPPRRADRGAPPGRGPSGAGGSLAMSRGRPRPPAADRAGAPGERPIPSGVG